jgi:uncharacterized protein YaeQ
VALTATLYSFEIDFSHVDRGVYEMLTFRAARHPSESAEFFVTRVLAYCLEYADGIQFSPQGLSDPDAPPLSIRDATGALVAWIDIGLPEAARLHKAAKTAPRVVVYTHKDPAQLVRALAGERIYRADVLELYALDRALIGELVAHRERRTKFDLTVTEGHLYVSIDGETLTGTVEKIAR